MRDNMEPAEMVQKRVNVNDKEFIEKIVLNRDTHSFPDPIISEIKNEDLLISYLSKVNRNIRKYEYKNEKEEDICEDFLERERERVNNQIGVINLPEIEEYIGLEENFVENIKNICLNTGYYISNRNIYWDTLEELFNLSVDKLRYISAYFKVHSSKSSFIDDELSIVNSIRFVKGDTAVGIRNITKLVSFERARERISVEIDGDEIDLKKGISFEVIKNELNQNLRGINSFYIALGIANIREINNYHHPKLSNGVYRDNTINYSDRIEMKNRNIFVHELFHSVQEVIATMDISIGDDCVDFEEDNEDNWSEVTFLKAENEKVTNFQETVKELWSMFRTGDFEKLCEYQTKNIHEMFSVAYEFYIESPEILKEKQPEVYNHLENLV